MDKKNKSKIIYQKGDDEIADLSNQIDFSQGFKNRKIAEALCHENPQEDRRLRYKLDSLDLQKRRKKSDHRAKQRDFFITQLFEKGLNPYINSSYRQCYTIGEDDAESSSDIEEGGGGKDKLEYYPNQHNNGDTGAGHVIFGLTRSQTLDEMSLSRTNDETNMFSLKGERNNNTTKGKYHNQLFPIKENTSLGTSPDNVLKFERKPLKYPENLPVSPSKEVLDRIKIPSSPNRFDLRTLRRNPSMLFPKLRGLLGGENMMSTKSRKSTPVQNQFSAVATTKSVNRKHPLPLIQITTEETTATEMSQHNMMKMIRELSTDLPHNLKITAKDQIRKMTNSDKIYKRKEDLKSENLPILEREHSFGDRRWNKLHSSLTRDSGIVDEWKQLYKAGPWVLQHRYTNKYKYC